MSRNCNEVATELVSSIPQPVRRKRRFDRNRCLDLRRGKRITPASTDDSDPDDPDLILIRSIVSRLKEKADIDDSAQNDQRPAMLYDRIFKNNPDELT